MLLSESAFNSWKGCTNFADCYDMKCSCLLKRSGVGMRLSSLVLFLGIIVLPSGLLVAQPTALPPQPQTGVRNHYLAAREPLPIVQAAQTVVVQNTLPIVQDQSNLSLRPVPMPKVATAPDRVFTPTVSPTAVRRAMCMCDEGSSLAVGRQGEVLCEFPSCHQRQSGQGRAF